MSIEWSDANVPVHIQLWYGGKQPLIIWNTMYKKRSPYQVEAKQDEPVFICQCGHTQTPPFCDGTHKQHAGIRPLVYKPIKDEVLYICGCGQSGNLPWCDGTHNQKTST